MAPETMTCAAVFGNLGGLSAFVEAAADRFGLDAEKKFGLLIAVEEAFVNICNYAYPGVSGDVDLICSAEGDAFVLEIADTGSPFDVLTLPDPDITLGLDDRGSGGLGVYFIRKLTDTVSYRRENGRNILRLTFRRKRRIQ